MNSVARRPGDDRAAATEGWRATLVLSRSGARPIKGCRSRGLQWPCAKAGRHSAGAYRVPSGFAEAFERRAEALVKSSGGSRSRTLVEERGGTPPGWEPALVINSLDPRWNETQVAVRPGRRASTAVRCHGSITVFAIGHCVGAPAGGARGRARGGQRLAWRLSRPGQILVRNGASGHWFVAPHAARSRPRLNWLAAHASGASRSCRSWRAAG